MGTLPMLMPRPAGRSEMRRLDRLGWRCGTCFEAQGLRLGVRSNDPQLLGRLPPALPPESQALRSPEVDRVYSVWVGRGGHRCRVYADAGRVARASDPARALAALESEMRQFLAVSVRDRVFVHAGVVGWRGRAILLPGSSRSGKTTLVAALVRGGASYLSDEFAPLDEQGLVHPFAKPLTIRGSGGCDLHARRRPVEELGGRRADGPLPVGLVAFSEYHSDGAWAPAVVTPGHALLRILAHTVPARLRPEASLDVLGRVVARALLLDGPRGEADETARRLLRALDERAECEGGAA